MRNIPVLCVTAKTLAEAYEKALIALYAGGVRFKTQYDKPDDPESIDATLNITVDEPMTDPMIHKAFPGGIEDLREYVYELEGLKDEWIKKNGIQTDTRWEYTYHGRFANYGGFKNKYGKPDSVFVNMAVDQFEAVVGQLVKQPFSRQAQMITWVPLLDVGCYDPPCLQSIWFRILEEEGVWYLNYNVRIRSNDAWGAYMMNSFGITMMVKELVADEIARRTGKVVKLGRMNWQADSWHVYGKNIKAFKEMLLDRVATTQFADRVYNFYDADIQEMYKESEPIILEKIRVESEKMLIEDMQ
jgi:thymidylate synthase